MRRAYIDNLRLFAVLLLFPYHTFMVYNNWESFYVHGPDSAALSHVLEAVWPWIMPLMFALAGLSAALALQKRGVRAYARERVSRLLVPFLSGLLLLVPVQTWIAGVYHRGAAGYFDLFAGLTDLTGYDGAFTPGHLWFLLYLFVISLAALPLVLLYKKRGKPAPLFSLPALLPLFVFPLVLQPVLDIAGKSVGEYFAFFLLGFFVLSREEAVEAVERGRLPLTVAASAGGLVVLLWGRDIAALGWPWYDVLAEAYAWVAVLALLGLFRRYASQKTAPLARHSFGLYLFHQSWLVPAAFAALKITPYVPLQILLILCVSFVLTWATCLLCERFAVTRRLFGLK